MTEEPLNSHAIFGWDVQKGDQVIITVSGMVIGFPRTGYVYKLSNELLYLSPSLSFTTYETIRFKQVTEPKMIKRYDQNL